MTTRSKFKSVHDPADEVIHLRAEIERLQGLIEGRKKDSGLISEQMGKVLSQVKVAPAPKLVYSAPSKTASPVTLVAHLTDWHVGQKTNSEHIEEFGEFDYATATRRVATFAQGINAKTTALRAAYTCDTLHIIGTADWVSGDIHEELIRTNEFPCPVQAVKSGYLLGAFIADQAPHYKNVVVDLLTAGNHDRITKKNQSEEGGLNSWGYVATEIAKQFVSSIPNVKVHIHYGLSDIITVGESRRYLITHGHGIKGTWGIPYYGVDRRVSKESKARMNLHEGKHFHKLVIGHFHASFDGPDWFVGGSLTGTGAHDHHEGRHMDPHQTTWVVHPKHGEFDFTRWFLR